MGSAHHQLHFEGIVTFLQVRHHLMLLIPLSHPSDRSCILSSNCRTYPLLVLMDAINRLYAWAIFQSSLSINHVHIILNIDLVNTWKFGDSKVLSTTTNTSFCRCAISETASISTIFNVGFVGVSIHTWEINQKVFVFYGTVLTAIFNQ